MKGPRDENTGEQFSREALDVNLRYWRLLAAFKVIVMKDVKE